ncbi:hypothetical protein FOA52_012031 [Chlamydomonas sp. UWO 241]|nr:hypothetical protein FOA52_012031 [Chlamydomonas sp. UWO 241]
MGFHRLPPTAIRLRLNRGFDSAWCATNPNHYAKLLQKDWLLSKSVWSFVQRSSRTLPKAQLTREQQLQQLSEARRTMEGGEGAAASSGGAAGAAAAGGQQQAQLRDYPNFRVGRVFLQHLPYKTYASAFAYVSPESGPQSKYGLFPSRITRPR